MDVELSERYVPSEDEIQLMLDREMGREEDQHPPDAFSLSQNDLRREVSSTYQLTLPLTATLTPAHAGC